MECWTVVILGLGDAGSVLFIEHVHALADEERKAKIPSNNYKCQVSEHENFIPYSHLKSYYKSSNMPNMLVLLGSRK